MIFSNVIETETAVVLLVTLERICASTQISALQRNWKSCFDTLLPKSKPVTVGFFYRPPNQAEFMNLKVEKSSNLNLKDNEIYLLSDFNIVLFQNGKSVLNGKGSPISQGSLYTIIDMKNFVNFTL